MLSLFVYNKEYQKARELSEKCSSHIERTGKKTDRLEYYSDNSELNSVISSFSDTSLYILRRDASLLQTANHIRSVNDSNYMVLVFGDVSEIVDLVSPTLRPSGLLPENAEDEKIGNIIDEVYCDYERSSTLYEGPVCRFSIKGADYRIPFCQIMVIEITAKKITLHTAAQNYGFYDTLENVMNDMPDYFMRVHRSFVVNKNYIKKVNYKERTIIMTDDSAVFFSRGYSAEIREYNNNTMKEILF